MVDHCATNCSTESHLGPGLTVLILRNSWNLLTFSLGSIRIFMDWGVSEVCSTTIVGPNEMKIWIFIHCQYDLPRGQPGNDDDTVEKLKLFIFASYQFFTSLVQLPNWWLLGYSVTLVCFAFSYSRLRPEKIKNKTLLCAILPVINVQGIVPVIPLFTCGLCVIALFAYLCVSICKSEVTAAVIGPCFLPSWNILSRCIRYKAYN